MTAPRPLRREQRASIMERLAIPGRLRLLFSLALLLAGPVLTLLGIWLVWIVWRGGWAVDRQQQQLEILALAMLLLLSGLLGVIVAIALGGPIGRLKGSVRGLVEAEISDDSRDDVPGRTDGARRSAEGEG